MLDDPGFQRHRAPGRMLVRKAHYREAVLQERHERGVVNLARRVTFADLYSVPVTVLFERGKRPPRPR